MRTASAVRVFLTEKRWTIRVLPPLILPSTLLLDASFVYVESAMEGWYFVASGPLHGSLAGLPWAAAMLLGLRLLKDHEPTEASTQNNTFCVICSRGCSPFPSSVRASV